MLDISGAALGQATLLAHGREHLKESDDWIARNDDWARSLVVPFASQGRNEDLPMEPSELFWRQRQRLEFGETRTAARMLKLHVMRMICIHAPQNNVFNAVYTRHLSSLHHVAMCSGVAVRLRHLRLLLTSCCSIMVIQSLIARGCWCTTL